MYKTFFGLTDEPFRMTPDPTFMYFSKKHTEALSYLHYGIEWKKGFIVLTGEIGAGKTTLCRTFLDQLTGKAKTALILNPNLSELQLLQSVVVDFGIKNPGRNKKELFDQLNHFLLGCLAEEKSAVLIIDEAQSLKPRLLEQIRLISNLETEKQKLIQMVLIGQPELATLLDNPSLRQLRQRIAVRYHLRALDFTETDDYIRHRLAIAGAQPDAITFTAQAMHELYTYSKGIPRLINITADKVLLAAYVRGEREITYPMVHEAIRDIEGTMNSAYVSVENVADALPVQEIP